MIIPGTSSTYTPPAGTTRSASGGRSTGCFFVLLLLAIGIAAALFVVPAGREVAPGLAEAIPGLAEPNTTADGSVGESSVLDQPQESLSGFLDPVLEFGGEEGSGPGFFEDTRWLGVDGDGFIYTADYDGGRVQVFDAAGTPQGQWFTESERIISALAVARDGTLYLLESGRGIFRYDGQTGDLLGQLPEVEFNVDDLAITVEGDLIALGDEGLAQYDAAGSAVQTAPGIFDSLDNDLPISVSDVAVDGENTLYVVTRFESSIYKFNAEGVFLDRIGQEGDEPGDFTSPTAIAVDGRGRIFVEDFTGIIVFDGDGRYLETIDVDGLASTLLFDTQNTLYRMDSNGNRVVKYALLR